MLNKIFYDNSLHIVDFVFKYKQGRKDKYFKRNHCLNTTDAYLEKFDLSAVYNSWYNRRNYRVLPCFFLRGTKIG